VARTSFRSFRSCGIAAGIFAAFLYAFDLLKVDGKDLRREPFESRKAMLAKLLRNAGPGLHVSEHTEGDGPTIFLHACKMGLEGIVSKRCRSRYQSGPTPHWVKSKNPNAPAVRREAGSRNST
jgi:bifunctional non-homologous end joining protein LigD